MDAVFKALADKTRRRLLDRLFIEQGQTLGQLCDEMAIRRQSVSKHLSVLERAELVSVIWRGREKHYYLNPMPLAEINRRWIDKFTQHSSDAVLNLKRAVEKTDGPGRHEDSSDDTT
ncbi:MAG: helix-turn-helix domain-containing protein [Pseudomonadota bacterium]